MRRRPFILPLLFSLLSICLMVTVLNAQGTGTPPAGAAESRSNSDPTYQALRSVGLSGETIAVHDFSFKRDVGTIFLKSGTLHLLAPVAGKITGAVFVGEGSFRLTPFAPMERQALSILTNDSEGILNEDFSQAVFRFTDASVEEFKKHSPAINGSPDPQAGDILKDHLHTLRRTLHYNLAARLLQDVLNPQPVGLFMAFVKGRKYSGKMIFDMDPHGVPALVGPAVEPEEVALMTYDESKQGVWYSFHYSTEYASGKASSKEKNGLIDIERQQLDTTIERNANLKGSATTQFVAESDGMRVVPFDLFPSLRVESVTDSGGQPLSYIQEEKDDDPQYSVILPKPLKLGEKFVIKTTYDGKDAVSNEGGGNYYPIARDNWYPNSRFGDYAIYEMTFRIPKGLTMVATGTPVSDATEGNQDVSVWRSEAPMAVAGFNFGRFKKEEAKDDRSGYLIESYANTNQPDFVRALQFAAEDVETGSMIQNINTTGMMKKALAEGELSVDLYTGYFGAIPYKRVALTQQTAMGFGQSWPTLVYLPITAFFDTTVRHTIGMDDTKGFFKVVGPHEVAHQWWGHAVGFGSYRDQWMSEGFAEFSSSLYVQVIQKRDQEFRKFWDDERVLMTEKNKFGKRAIDVGPLTQGYRLSNSKSGFDISRRLIYPKGAFVLHMIRMMMWDRRSGDQSFSNMMKDFVKTYSNQVATTEDFKAMVEKHITPPMDIDGNKKMDWFFNEYVYGTSLPEYGFEYSFKPAENGKVMMHLKITQSNVNKDFVMRVPIYLELADSRVIRLGSLVMEGSSAKEQDVPLEGLKDKPKQAFLNYFDDVLCSR